MVVELRALLVGDDERCWHARSSHGEASRIGSAECHELPTIGQRQQRRKQRERWGGVLSRYVTSKRFFRVVSLRPSGTRFTPSPIGLRMQPQCLAAKQIAQSPASGF